VSWRTRIRFSGRYRHLETFDSVKRFMPFVEIVSYSGVIDPNRGGLIERKTTWGRKRFALDK
jgi:hypothetical protein